MASMTLQARNEQIRRLLLELEKHAPGEQGHALRVAVYSTATAHAMSLRDSALLQLRYAASLHDIGKLRLTAKQLATGERKRHPQLALEVLGQYAWLTMALPAIESHHERWDGKGYPKGLKGEEIPFGGRVIAVAEAFDSLANPVSWREPIGRDAALSLIGEAAGSQFDPAAVQAFLRVEPLVQPIGSG